MTSGANVSMSGHRTMTSRGSSVGSARRMPRIVSRRTSTWRSGPWQRCTRMLPSSTAGRAAGARSWRRSSWSWASSVVGVVAAAWCRSVRAARPGRDRRSCSSRTSRPRLASRGCATACALVSSARRLPSRPSRPVQSAGEGWGSQRWTSWSTARASRTVSSVSDSRVAPKSERRAGKRPAGTRTSATVSAGLTVATRARSRRHSSGCQRRSSGVCVSSPTAQARTSAGRWSA